MRNGTANWPERPLGKLLDIARQTVTPSAHPAEQFVHYSIPAWDETRGPALELGASIGSAKICINQPTILVSKLNPRIPRVVLVEKPMGPRHCASTEFMPYVAKANGISLRFYKWFLQSPMFQRRLERIATGSTNSHTRAHPAETLQWNVPSPSLEDQRRIAAVLDTADEAIAKTEVVIAKLRQVRAGLVHDLLTRGLDEHGQLRDPIAHPEQFHDAPVGRIPIAWELRRLGACSLFITSGSRGWAAHYSKDGPIFLRIGNLTREHINLRFDDVVRVQPPAGSEGARTRVEAGDILISITADLGIIGVIPDYFDEAYVNQHIALVRPKQPIVPKWLGRFLAFGPAAGQFQMLNDTGAKAGMNLPAVESLLVAVPSREEQLTASSALDAIDEEIDGQLHFVGKLERVKSGLMTDLLTGRVRVPEHFDIKVVDP